jgi:hypothetical protein
VGSIHFCDAIKRGREKKKSRERKVGLREGGIRKEE